MERLRGFQMQTELNKLIQHKVFDMLCIVFIGHGFGKGPGYLKGSDLQVIIDMKHEPVALKDRQTDRRTDIKFKFYNILIMDTRQGCTT
jgi:hypothetical protein